ncbi:hypothetical protein [Chitinasiproducens palmae]|uniref:Lipoprotein n=1 Tax=Chitinasiproducens palmae TaxID=1770053 RepID=A0A1H2PSD2_9BURK|nr:hypothetical protein [Chitinasiproducens palmae]SDV49840.1 hypothetical protein SAMN05216551_109182 [Chitinasiproducens palmae]
MRAFVAAIALALAGCQSAPTATPEPEVVYKTQTVDTACSWAKLIILTPAEAAALPDGVAQQVLAHDREWSKHCGVSR